MQLAHWIGSVKRNYVNLDTSLEHHVLFIDFHADSCRKSRILHRLSLCNWQSFKLSTVKWEMEHIIYKRQGFSSVHCFPWKKDLLNALCIISLILIWKILTVWCERKYSSKIVWAERDYLAVIYLFWRVELDWNYDSFEECRKRMRWVASGAIQIFIFVKDIWM